MYWVCSIRSSTVLLLVLDWACLAERLPIKSYTTADGLVHDHINRIRRDLHGFLWFCTDGGLSRFDGYTFTNYTIKDGLPHLHVNDLLESRHGAYWIATDAGVCRFNPKGSTTRGTVDPMFRLYPSSADERAHLINTLFEDRSGAIWCGTNGGLYRLDASRPGAKPEFVDIGLPTKTRDDAQVDAIIMDRTGAMWIGGRSGLYRWKATGPAEWYMLRAPGLTRIVKPSIFSDDHTRHAGISQSVNCLLEDRNGRILVGSRYAGLFRVSIEDVRQPAVERIGPGTIKLPNHDIRSLSLSADGAVWVGFLGGLIKLMDKAGNGGDQRTLHYTTANGLNDPEIYEVTETGADTLWIGTYQSGVMRIALRDLTTYGEADHFRPSDFNSILETHLGEICVTGGDYSSRFMQCFDGNTFRSAWPKLPKQVIAFGWSSQQTTFQDHTGEWWVATAAGLFRFPKVRRLENLNRTLPKRAYTMSDGLRWNDISRLYEDSRGDIWIGTNAPALSLSRWERSTDKINTYVEPRLPLHPTAFREDASGDIWIGHRDNGGLVRYRSGRFTLFTSSDGVPAGSINMLYLDRLHRLWIASSEGGVARLDDPSADSPYFKRYTTSAGLSSDEIWSVTEDLWGRIYLSTGRGLDRLDPGFPQPAHVKHYGPDDGLAKGGLRVSLRDRQGALWFVTTRGISRLVPGPEVQPSIPAVLIEHLQIAGVRYPVSEIGEIQIGKLDLPPERNAIEVGYVGLDFSLGGRMRYQYRLQGVDRDWSSLTEQRTVNYAALAPGAYLFEVRAVNSEGGASVPPARLVFQIRRPIWQRRWFVVVAVLCAAALIYTAHRYHVGRAIALERVRTRIAADLHDDIGSSLSRMAILSEVVKRELAGAHPQSARLLADMAESARGLVDAMGDIVWSIDPRKDDVDDLVLRVRQFAFDLLGAGRIHWRLDAPDSGGVKLEAEERRNVFLILKEALHNAVRHSGCDQVDIAIRVDSGYFKAEVRDNGHGMNGVLPGNGLANMSARASELGGHCEIVPAPCGGTVVRLSFRVKKWG